MPTPCPPARPITPAPPEPLLRWELRRHRSLRPGQLFAGCALPCALALVAGAAFASVGCPWPLRFALLQTTAMLLACLAQVRHGRDRAVLTVRGAWLEVVKRRGSRVSVNHLPLVWLRMRVDAQGLHLACGASSVRIHGYASPAACAAVLRDLEQARRGAVLPRAGLARSALPRRSEGRWRPGVAC